MASGSETRGSRFSVVIATRGRPDPLRRGLESLAACAPPPGEVIVVDSDPAGSARRVVEEFAGRGLPARYCTAAAGLTHQRNVGLERTTGAFVAFMDDDVRLEPGAFALLADAFSGPGVAGVTGRIVEPASGRVAGEQPWVRRLLPGGGVEGGFTRFGYPRRLVHLDRRRDMEFMHGAFMSARAELAHAERFDETLAAYALAEDEDFSRRLSRRGRIIYLPDLVVHHDKLGHGGRETRAFGRMVVVNRHYLFRKNFPATPTDRALFWTFMLGLVAHRAVNREWAEARGLLEGVATVLVGRGLNGRPAPERAVRVSFVSSHARLGGSEAYLEGLVEELADDWVEEVVYLEAGQHADRLKATGTPVALLPTGRRISILASAMRLRRHLLRSRPGVVHANGVKAALVCGLATWGTSIPVVWVKHDFSWDGWLGRFVAWQCEAIVGVSRAVLEPLAGTRTPQRIVHAGLAPIRHDRGRARTLLEEATGFRGPVRFVGSVGRLEPTKGHDDAIAAAALAAQRVPELRLVIAGGDNQQFPGYADSLRARIEEAGLGKKAVLLGHREDAIRLMAGLDCGLVLSGAGAGRGEGFGLVAAELMAVGTPVIAYRAGAIEEVVGDCGHLVSPDPSLVGDALTEVLADREEWCRMSECGLGRAAAQFRRSDAAAAMQRVYRDAASQ